MDSKGYCRLCGKIKVHFCCQSCYELDATKSTSKQAMRREIAELRKALKDSMDGYTKTQLLEMYPKIITEIIEEDENG